MEVIYCVAFDPMCGVGGVDWRRRFDAAETLYLDRCSDSDYDNCDISYFELRVREGMASAQITMLADAAAWERTYTAIRCRAALETT